MSLKALWKNSLKPGYAPVMAEKAWLRLSSVLSTPRDRLALKWCESTAESFESFGERWDKPLLAESLDFSRQLRERARALLNHGHFSLLSGGHTPLLYFLIRRHKPQTVIETGVAAGFSSQCILSALGKNGQGGRLHSSDFPYFRLPEPEKHIGVLVEARYHSQWQLYLRGDRRNIPLILSRIESLDFLHYDSEKRRAGRKLVLDLAAPRLHDRSLLVMDDIQDNFFFRDWVHETGRPWKVFGFQGKFVGVAGAV